METEDKIIIPLAIIGLIIGNILLYKGLFNRPQFDSPTYAQDMAVAKRNAFVGAAIILASLIGAVVAKKALS